MILGVPIFKHFRVFRIFMVLHINYSQEDFQIFLCNAIRMLRMEMMGKKEQ